MTETALLIFECPDWLYELSLSIYSSLLFVWFEASKPFAWPTRYLYFWHPHAVSLSRIDFFLFYLEVFIGLAAVIFVGFRFIRLFSLARAVLRAIGGALALVGFPLVCLGRENTLLFIVALAVAGFCFLLWARRKWLISTPLSIVLLVVYYALCSFFGGGASLMNKPAADWAIWDYAWLSYV